MLVSKNKVEPCDVTSVMTNFRDQVLSDVTRFQGVFGQLSTHSKNELSKRWIRKGGRLKKRPSMNHVGVIGNGEI